MQWHKQFMAQIDCKRDFPEKQEWRRTEHARSETVLREKGKEKWRNKQNKCDICTCHEGKEHKGRQNSKSRQWLAEKWTQSKGRSACDQAERKLRKAPNGGPEGADPIYIQWTAFRERGRTVGSDNKRAGCKNN
ncbi:hypothetical protein AA0472_2506 [Acetobacter estunensis NRIC 0472]|nr:hypothetical protein AA0472_2506 [Acetobacter estunensis NRIC 0472]